MHQQQSAPPLPVSSRWPFGSAALLAWRNLIHDRARFAVTLVGIVFAVVLIAVQIGLFLGFTTTTTAVIDNTRADLWIASKGTRYIEMTSQLSERHYYKALATPGIETAERLIVQFGFWLKPDGGRETIIVIGMDLDSDMIRPWSIAVGSRDSLRLPDTILIDTLYKAKLGVDATGDIVELAGYRARIAGFTSGIRSFTTAPYIFTSLKNARNYARQGEGQSNFVIARVAPGHDIEAVRRDLASRLDSAVVVTTAEMAAMTKDYWIFTTGAGMALLTAAFLGLVVGVVIVAQVLYATTVDHLPEFGTLRAMGAPRGFIYRIILGQAAISATLGHAFGIAVALAMARASETWPALISIPLPVAGGLFFVTFGMCTLASTVSIRKAMAIDPAMVFQR